VIAFLRFFEQIRFHGQLADFPFQLALCVTLFIFSRHGRSVAASVYNIDDKS